MPAFVVGCITRNPHLDDENLPDLEEQLGSLPRKLTNFEKRRAEMAKAAPGALARRRGDEGGSSPGYAPVSRQSVRGSRERWEGGHLFMSYRELLDGKREGEGGGLWRLGGPSL
ncbi:hypothetical protein TrCOL_g5655 [Triparma columacea]|uniref:Uncharacterized protein n=1 Tax=Triparma columacea TaxID=722753 RepID=A0A9W7LE60_9STRA|nr:hypothetical protein TrCOL_g5655 [Triparma columacea]